MSDLVIFDKEGAKHIKDHWVRPYRSPFVKVIKNPDLSIVKDIEPIFWKLEGYSIIEMTPDEKIEKLKIKTTKHPMQALYPWWTKLIAIIIVVGALYYFKVF